MKRKLLLILLAISATLICAFGLAACNPKSENDPWKNLNFEKNSEGGYTVTGFKTPIDTDTEITIPSEYNGKPVTSIGEKAFYGCAYLKAVTIPDSITYIGEKAFTQCFIETATIPAFACIHIKNRELKTVVITCGSSIDNNAFYDCSKLTSVTIADSITKIGESAFYNCPFETATIPAFACSYISKDALKTLVITSGKTVDEKAFCDNSVLTSVTLPDSLTSIGNNAFENCTSLTKINIPNRVTKIGQYAFVSCSSLTSITIPNGITEIVEGTFAGCTSLTSITVPNSVTEIGDRALSSCSSLTSITIPDSVTTIGYSALSGCTSLTSITIPNGVTTIGNGAFSWCSALIDVILPNSVTEIGAATFSECKSLTTLTLPNKITAIADDLFKNCTTLTEIKLPNSITEIGQYAFSCCSSLISINIPDNTVSISEDTFRECTALTSIIIPNSVLYIKNNAFYNCHSLTIYCEATRIKSGWINFDNNDTYSVIWDCKNNDKDKNGYIYAVIDGLRYALKDNVATLAKQPKNTSGDIVLPQKVTYKNNEYSVTTISEGAFVNCPITTITIPACITSVKNDAVINNYPPLIIYCEEASKPSGWDSLWNNGCTVIWNCKFNDKDENGFAYAVIDGLQYSLKDGDATLICQTKKIVGNIVIPEKVTYKGNGYSVTSIGEYAFSDCTSLTTVIIPKSVTTIQRRAFIGCTSITSVTFSNGVTYIGERAFEGCSSLKSLIIPTSITSIEILAFNCCFALTDITFEGSKTEWDSIKRYGLLMDNIGDYTVHCTDGDLEKE